MNFLENINNVNYFKKKLYFIAYLHSNYALYLIPEISKYHSFNKFINIHKKNVKY